MQSIPPRDDDTTSPELAIVEGFAMSAASAPALEELLRTALEALESATKCASCYCLLEDENDPQKYVLYHLSPGGVAALERPASPALLQELSESGRVLSVPATGAAARELDLGSTLKTLLLVPMRSKGTIVGMMILGTTTDLGFTPPQVAVANIVASHVSIAVRNTQLSRRIQESSGVDPVTGLPGQPQFAGCLEFEAARATRYRRWLSVAIIEIDGLGELQCRSSDGAAEAALRDVAMVIQKQSRSLDFVGRFAEAQFGAVLPETDVDGAKTYAERIRGAARQLSIMPPSSKDEILVTVSIGVTSYQASLQGGLSPDNMISKATQALRSAKAGGGNQVSVS